MYQQKKIASGGKINRRMYKQKEYHSSYNLLKKKNTKM